MPGKPRYPDSFFAPIDDRLGLVPDRILAEEIGVSKNVVTWYRVHKRKIVHALRYNPWGANYIDWSKIDPLLGTLSDRALAANVTGVAASSITNRRRKLKIAPYFQSRVPWEKMIPYFGTLTDAEIGRRFHVPHNRVRYWRLKVGIQTRPGWQRDCAKKNRKPVYDNVLLGIAADATIARALGVSNEAVGSARKVRGIPRASITAVCICGREFIKRSGYQKHCSKECSQLTQPSRQHRFVMRRHLPKPLQDGFADVWYAINVLSRRIQHKETG